MCRIIPMFRFRFGLLRGRFRVHISVLFKQLGHVLSAVYNVSYLYAIIVREVEDDVAGVGYCVTTQSFGE